MLCDSFGRNINYLRISVTQRCNFRCQYCMPQKNFSWMPKENLLSIEEMFLFVKIAIDEGIEKIRITGGEPLLRKDLDLFIKMITDYKKLDIALTTNGFLLSSMAQKLKNTGLKRINVSLDSLDAKTIEKISQKDALKKVLDGIFSAKEAGLKIKLNCVPLKNINDHELIKLLEFAKENNFMIRFIEYMENHHANQTLQGLKSDEIKAKIYKAYPFESVGKKGSSPAEIYELKCGYRFGIIDPHQHEFCSSCNRIRLSADGLLIPCLYFDEAVSIAEAIRARDLEKAGEILRMVIKNKPEKNRWHDQEVSNRAFYQTGG